MTARLHRWALATSIALFVLATGSDASAAPGQVLKDKEALAHFERAQEHFQSEDYAAAIPELKAAYGLEPNPMLLYAWAQAERLAGSCTRAVGLYRRFLETNPAAEQRQLAEANLLDCEAELPDPQVEAEPEIEPLDPEEDTEASVTDDEPRRWVTDPVGGALLGLGVVGVASGGVLMGLARRRGKQAPNADVEDDYLQTLSQAERMNTAGIVTLSVGSALVMGAVIRYALVAKKGRSPKEAPVARVAPLFAGQGVGLQLGLRW